jgi:hypothetical protein
LGKGPLLLRITGTERAKMPARKMFLDADVPLGNLFDAIVDHGDVPDVVARADTTELKKTYGPELERRSRLMREAFELWRKRR